MKGYYVILTTIIKKHGGYFVRTAKGDHEIWWCNGVQETVDRGIKSRYLANKILKALLIEERID